MRPTPFHTLYTLATDLAPTTPDGRRFGPDSTFSSIGLTLYLNEHRCDNETTPLNADTFATTACDGDHFNFLHIPGLSIDDSPIVMTIPTDFGGPWNYVVGENLLDFLALGCRTGYTILGSLAFHERDEAIDALQRGDDADFDDTERHLLTAIRTRFNLSPWPEVRARLATLHTRFAPHIQLSDQAKEWLKPLP